MKTFEMFRQQDETGISGTGKVIEGVIFSDGECVVRWVAEDSNARCVSIWPNFGSFMTIHVHPHPDNSTRIVFSDGSVLEHKDGALAETPAPAKARRKKKDKGEQNG